MNKKEIRNNIIAMQYAKSQSIEANKESLLKMNQEILKELKEFKKRGV